MQKILVSGWIGFLERNGEWEVDGSKGTGQGRVDIEHLGDSEEKYLIRVRKGSTFSVVRMPGPGL